MTSPQRWGAFAVERPEMADAGRALLYQHGPGLAFLATVRGTTTQDDTLFEFLLEHAMWAKYEGRPSWPPVYSIWNDGGAEPKRG